MRGLLDCTLLLVLCAVAALAQYDGDYGAPAPPRLQIPGAVPLGPAPPRRPPVGGARIQARRQPAQQLPQQSFEDAPRIRTRGPGARAGRLPLAPAPAPSPAPQFFSPPPPQRVIPQPEENLPPRPVVEEAEDDYEEEPIYSPSPSPSTPPPPPPPPPQPQRPAPSPSPVPSFRPERPLPVFRPERPAVLPTPSPELNYVSPTRQQLRPTAFPAEEDVRQRKPLYKGEQQFNSRNKVRPTPVAVEQPQFSRQPPQQSQSQFNRAQSVVRAPAKPVYSTSGKDGFEKPERQYQRTKKPVAQVLRRYREDNEDGSITWGFENDDGSFKEETIGTDCVTYGKYGYIDPDGTRREYTYSTGIPCDKTEDAQTQGSEGYIDYAENKYVLPNGDKIDLNKMGKSSRRQVAAQPQQQYRS